MQPFPIGTGGYSAISHKKAKGGVKIAYFLDTVLKYNTCTFVHGVFYKFNWVIGLEFFDITNHIGRSKKLL